MVKSFFGAGEDAGQVKVGVILTEKAASNAALSLLGEISCQFDKGFSNDLFCFFDSVENFQDLLFALLVR